MASALKMRSGASRTHPPCASLCVRRTPRGSRGFASPAIVSPSATRPLYPGRNAAVCAFERRIIRHRPGKNPEVRGRNAMRPTMKIWSAVAFATILALPTQAEDYPNKAVQFITPAAAGNSPDVVTHIIADKLTQIWKQQVVVINRPGAGGLIAAQAAAQLPKDGYSIYMTQASTWTVLPIQQEGKMPVDLHKAFVPIGMVGEQPIAIGVGKDVPAKSVAELVALANKTKDGMLFAATNRGGQAHLTGELFRNRSKANISFVHAAGAAVSINDVLAGRSSGRSKPRRKSPRRSDRLGHSGARAKLANPESRNAF
ncbi:MAG: hypothetical protein EXQ82_12155 [Pseudolabrys sp.]|nr:hypothetical protein [Pseudolabrys sp.]